ncbi:universal stress protein [Flavimarina sp. Hel_I_48]|uniref:universal stress protein n=1 Tax=Flavimarina sp. Hel_I_48 TaxID=1392488 RepID=UPI0004DF8648|nr:universal stress protein [Flavimarina sp. Hel_I_48]
MRKICIALDYSPTSEQVLKTGYEYSLALGAKVSIIHVVSDAVYYMDAHDSMMGYDGFNTITNVNVLEDLRETSQKYLDTVVSDLGDPNVESSVIEGEVSEAILEYAEAWGADLLVLGTHGRGFLENMLMGNTAVNIVKHTKIPLLIVPVKKENNDQ